MICSASLHDDLSWANFVVDEFSFSDRLFDNDDDDVDVSLKTSEKSVSLCFRSRGRGELQLCTKVLNLLTAVSSCAASCVLKL